MTKLFTDLAGLGVVLVLNSIAKVGSLTSIPSFKDYSLAFNIAGSSSKLKYVLLVLIADLKALFIKCDLEIEEKLFSKTLHTSIAEVQPILRARTEGDSVELMKSPSEPPSSKSSNPLPATFSSRPSTSSSNLSQSLSKPPPSSSSPSPSSLKPPLASSISYASFLKTTEPPPTSSSASSPTSKKPPQSSPSVAPNSSASGPCQTSTNQPPAFKPILRTAANNVTDEEGKMSYMCEKGTPIHAIPEDIKGQIKRDIVPQVLKQPLSSLTYVKKVVP
ncbi:flocculation protein FLO11-like [Quercus lobata]|uniref:flocculation protein FLO11-like n=1 Tax=Quercus lobata TaxID=97700 RepID=UPI00124543AA|nr:flocculation protein FLO11-like [Quercus lobata]